MVEMFVFILKFPLSKEKYFYLTPRTTEIKSVSTLTKEKQKKPQVKHGFKVASRQTKRFFEPICIYI